MKYLVIMVTICLASCSTVKTLNPENDHVNIQHRGKNSYCESIPRVYSGFLYNLCKARSEPSMTEDFGSEVNGVPVVVIDTVFSTAADTIALPYTLFRQVKDGNIAVN